MNKENRDKIIASFPTFFKNKWAYPQVGNGWYDLVFKICYGLMLFKKPADFHVMQVKEKFGCLCFYASSGPTEMFDFIHSMEDKSLEICEKCGKPGYLRTDHRWWQTLCDGCADAREPQV